MGFAANLLAIILVGTLMGAAGLTTPATAAPLPAPAGPGTGAFAVLVYPLLVGGVGGMAGSAFLGVLQWPAVEQSGVARRAWLVAHAVGGAPAFFFVLALLDALSRNAAAEAAGYAAAGGLSYAAPTGLVLARSWRPVAP